MLPEASSGQAVSPMLQQFESERMQEIEAEGYMSEELGYRQIEEATWPRVVAFRNHRDKQKRSDSLKQYDIRRIVLRKQNAIDHQQHDD